jgi:hypothetical protein
MVDRWKLRECLTEHDHLTTIEIMKCIDNLASGVLIAARGERLSEIEGALRQLQVVGLVFSGNGYWYPTLRGMDIIHW